MGVDLLLVGASVRAAAFSAIRAGFQPWGADLFGDLDLRQHCPGTVVAPEDYPEGLLDVVAEAPQAPLLYTGALENHPEIVAHLGRLRPLWGNPPEVLARVRWPAPFAALVHRAGLTIPEVRDLTEDLPTGPRWLLKPLASAGGSRIRFWDGSTPSGLYYLQAFLEGVSHAALYLGTASGARLLGVTRQLVGEPWLGTSDFRYCGSVGPVPLSNALCATLERLGNVLAQEGGVRGIFGVDLILQNEVPWPVEVNPRYTASVEVLEYATGWPLLRWHADIFAQREPTIPPPQRNQVIAKGVLYARHPIALPPCVPWAEQLCHPPGLHEAPDFADLPPPEASFEQGHPMLTIFTRGETVAKSLDRLQQRAQEVYQWFENASGGTAPAPPGS